MNGEALTLLVYLTALVAGMSGLYGVMTARSLVKLFISVEVFFNSVVLTAAYTGLVAGARPGFYSVLLATIMLTIAEIAVVAALLILVYRKKRSMSVDLLKETRG
ncbi:hypothetical protein CF15_04655 [Pyrodictium occultum]|uniref:NADH dehydrogenase n=1 Tax=Pyrodictium occultum TaxID=2309 RepID=A0A0V8RVM4_PYROC|nr:NADH-quinone oxidoreductase subunit K [Pyrodictium occultum]KSW12072.1 hypothetical protein CF15_04655 [Pyrodictium occultum]